MLSLSRPLRLHGRLPLPRARRPDSDRRVAEGQVAHDGEQQGYAHLLRPKHRSVQTTFTSFSHFLFYFISFSFLNFYFGAADTLFWISLAYDYTKCIRK